MTNNFATYLGVSTSGSISDIQKKLSLTSHKKVEVH